MKKIKNKSRVRIATGFCFVFMASYAISFAMYSTILPSIIEFYKTDLTTASLFNVSESLGHIVIMFLTMLFADRVNKNKLLGAIVTLFGLVLIFSGKAPSFFVFLLMRVALGMTSSVCDNLTAAYISDITGENRAQTLSILHSLFGVGSLVGPLFAAYLLENGFVWQDTYVALGSVVLASGLAFLIVFAVIRKPDSAVVDGDSAGLKIKPPYLEMLKNRNVAVLCFANVLLSFFMYFTSWLPTYLKMDNPAIYTTDITAYIITMYSVGMIISRLSYAGLSKKLRAATYLQYQAIITAAVAASGLIVSNLYYWFVVAFLIGLVSGANYTAKFVLACEEYPRFSSTVTAITAIATALGSMIANPLINFVADTLSYKTAMFIPVAALVIVYALYLFGFKKEAKPA
ncbi:MAG: MFS transporter [Oscillospiraceae bacterium]